MVRHSRRKGGMFGFRSSYTPQAMVKANPDDDEGMGTGTGKSNQMDLGTGSDKDNQPMEYSDPTPYAASLQPSLSLQDVGEIPYVEPDTTTLQGRTIFKNEDDAEEYINAICEKTQQIMAALKQKESAQGGRRKRGGNRTERKVIDGQTYDVTYDDNNNEISRVLATTATTNAGNGSGSGSSSSTKTEKPKETNLDDITLTKLVTDAITHANEKLVDWANKSKTGFVIYILIRVFKSLGYGVSVAASGVGTAASGVGSGLAAVVGLGGCTGKKRYVTKFVIIAVLVALGYYTSDKIEELANYITAFAKDKLTNAYQAIMDFECVVSAKNSFLQNQVCGEYAALLNDAKLGQSVAQQAQSALVKAGGVGAIIWGVWTNASAIFTTVKNVTVGTFTGANDALDVIIDAFCETTVATDRITARANTPAVTAITTTKDKTPLKTTVGQAAASMTTNAAGSGSSSSSSTTTTTTASPGAGSGSGSGSSSSSNRNVDMSDEDNISGSSGSSSTLGRQPKSSRKERSGSQTRNGGRRTRRHQQKRRHTRRY